MRHPIDFVWDYGRVRIKLDNPFCNEKLVHIKDHGISGDSFYYIKDNPPYHQSIPGSLSNIYLRKTVVEKLKRINESLVSMGLELYVFDGYRPVRVQNYFFFHWVPNFLRKTFPHKSEKWIEKQVSSYWSKGSTSINQLRKMPPPHCTGGAVDLSIRYKKTGLLMEMGTIFDDTTNKSHTRFFEKEDVLQQGFTALEAQKNRRLLFHIMSDFGFSSHPKEWWHFSYGDQMWAHMLNKEYALYGYIEDFDFQ